MVSCCRKSMLLIWGDGDSVGDEGCSYCHSERMIR